MKTFVTAALMLSLMTGIRPLPAAATGDVGDLAPDFQLENLLDASHGMFTLSDHRGSVVVIAFFAWW